MVLQDFFSNINQHWKNKKPFVVYTKPNSNRLVAQLQKSEAIEKVDYNIPGFVLAPFITGKQPVIWFSEHKAEKIEAYFEDDLILIGSQKEGTKSLDSKKAHLTIIDKALGALEDGELQKVVLSRIEEILIKQTDPLLYFQRMYSRYPNTFCYCWYHPQIGMWLGATPETLIKLEQASFETMALAGTQPYTNTVNVEWGNKEKEEQQYVVDSILEELKTITTNISVGQTQTQKAGSLLHLRTDIRGILESANALQSLINVLHPTPAVCGLPKLKAQQFILDNEGYNRNYYTGYLGVVDPLGDTSLFVNLRCMEINNETLKIYVGGGITTQSNPEAEWEETVNKSQIMKQIL